MRERTRAPVAQRLHQLRDALVEADGAVRELLAPARALDLLLGLLVAPEALEVGDVGGERALRRRVPAAVGEPLLAVRLHVALETLLEAARDVDEPARLVVEDH